MKGACVCVCAHVHFNDLLLTILLYFQTGILHCCIQQALGKTNLAQDINFEFYRLAHEELRFLTGVMFPLAYK